MRAKKVPKLEKLLAREAARQPQTPDQQFAIFMAMAKASKLRK